MPVRGRNMAPGARITSFTMQGNDTAANNGSQASGNIVTAAIRTSIQLSELGVTLITGSGGSTITAAASSLKWYHVKDGSATAIASVNVASGAAVGTELTSRDGTITWIGVYENPASREFPKGSYIGVEFDSGANGNTGNSGDTFVCYAYAPEFGAEPA